MAKKRTHEEFITELGTEFLEGYDIIDRYESSHVKIEIVHKLCGNRYKVSPVNLLSGKRCKKCSDKMNGLKRKASHNDFIKKVHDIVGSEYTVLSEYKASRVKIKMRHNTCSHEYEVTPNNFTSRGRRCPNCFGKLKRTQKQFVDEVYELVGEDYEVLGAYVNANEKLTMKHNVCGNVYEVTPSMFTNSGNRCPMCIYSRGEYTIKTILESINIDFKREYTFPDLFGLGGWYLRFDFAVFIDDNLICLIEYDGEFHYRDYFKDNQHERTKAHDKIKNAYCEDNNIPLLRIPYWEFDNIEKLVTEFLHNIKEENNDI